ncbi:MAG TPA: class E sortase [Acidimicrobiales bacterium]|nr:class E sortase [Acidimicrobiales bacterium]
MRRGHLTGAVGRVLLSLGTVILLFVAYQLWGTGIAESHSQSVLRQKLDGELHRAHVGSSPTATTTPRTTGHAAPAPTTGDPGDGQPVGLLEIPRIGVDKVIVEGTSTTDLRQGPGHYLGTPLPGQAGNAAIAGHRTTYGAPFYNLNELSTGDPLVVTTTQGVFTYRVTRSLVVPCGDSDCNDPADLAVIAPSATPELTLTTCNPRFSSTGRLVVQAALAEASVKASVAATTPTTAPTGRRALTAASTDLAGGEGSWVPALSWGCGVLAVGAAVWLLARRRRRGRWLVYGAGGAGVLVVLFFFFGAVSPLLPASF